MVALPLLLITLLSPPHLQLTVTPHVCHSPCTIRVQVRIPPSPENRWWVVEVDGPTYSSSVNQLEGEQSPTTQPIKWFYGLVEGEYEVVVDVLQQDGKILNSVRESVVVD